MAEIKFGTSGWRAIIAEDFTFENVRLATAGIAELVKKSGPQPRLLVGCDTRFQADKFAWECAEFLSSKGIQVYYCQGPAPTPAIAFEILNRKVDGGINFTASHNPGEYCGLKFSGADGAPALPEVTRQIEQNIRQLQAGPNVWGHWTPRSELIEQIDPAPEYLKALAAKVDLSHIRKAGLRISYDPLYGTARGYLDKLFSDSGVAVSTIHNFRDVLFGGHPPEPAEEHLEDLRADMRRHESKLGLSTDGDADRFGILDEGGAFITPNQIIPLLLDYLIETRGWSGGAARSVATSHFLDAVARSHKRELHETPVGFKYIGELIKADKIVIGGEESAGLTIKGHVPEKDGILACLLVAEMVARRNKNLRQQLAEIESKVGAFRTVRLNLHLTPELKEALKAKLESPPASLVSKPVVELNRTDGLKLILQDGSWVLLRLSGTEPVARCYVEAHSPEELNRLTEAASELVRGST
ncbi:MAG: phosphoglucomutase/phosphomannomutase family protein [Acidobacteria bacterium]|nr:phosphoglucomutase/phosphomannomutase family protein [Acidobacteriota bacterium]